MREPENCTIEYCGYSKPESSEELEFEILGLQHAVKIIETRIALLKQSRFIAAAAINKKVSSISDMFGENNESGSNKDSKRKENQEKD